jgi:hypothetical protein
MHALGELAVVVCIDSDLVVKLDVEMRQHVLNLLYARSGRLLWLMYQLATGITPSRIMCNK